MGGQSQAIGQSRRSLTVALLHGQVLLTACRLNVFDVLKDRGPLTAADVAHEIDASVDGTERLLDVCAALGLLQKAGRGEGPPACRRGGPGAAGGGGRR